MEFHKICIVPPPERAILEDGSKINTYHAITQYIKRNV